MKLVILACLAAVALARPQDDPVGVLRDYRVDNGDGSFSHIVETENGIYEERTGTVGAEGQTNMEGVFRFPHPDGTIAEVRFIANENGFQPLSDLLPTPHPLPAHAIEQIRIAEQQRAEGIVFE